MVTFFEQRWEGWRYWTDTMMEPLRAEAEKPGGGTMVTVAVPGLVQVALGCR